MFTNKVFTASAVSAHPQQQPLHPANSTTRTIAIFLH